MTKKLLRRKLRELRNAIPKYVKVKLDKFIKKNILSLKEFQTAKIIMAFVNFDSEVDTLQIIKSALKNNKVVAVPKVITKPQKKILPVRIKNLTNLKKGYYGILEPKSIKNLVKPEEIDFVLVPGIGFDLKGNRLGYGGGFYDKFLEKIPIEKRIGIAYEIQIVNKIPTTDSDIPVGKIVTEKGVRICSRQ